jgi:hypothetical protein
MIWVSKPGQDTATSVWTAVTARVRLNTAGGNWLAADLRLKTSIQAWSGMNSADILIVTALKEELTAAREAGSAGYGENPGILAWERRDVDSSTPYLLGHYRTADNRSFSVASARSTRMGATAVSPVVSGRVERLKPT